MPTTQRKRKQKLRPTDRTAGNQFRQALVVAPSAGVERLHDFRLPVLECFCDTLVALLHFRKQQVRLRTPRAGTDGLSFDSMRMKIHQRLGDLILRVVQRIGT